MQRLRRLEQGNYGDVAPIGDGLSELRMFFGSGYRVYFGEDAENIVVVLCGGDKSTQNQDIEDAKAYWKEYLSGEKI
ncbi:MAG: type II toxin-antitoxin system RelE/ParE family toxin [Nostoc sp.]|uniref:type II toxin-antitoxin system RelE/ParE family toxin n=1 Tax=Nostoc sp. TaxID=1180 RepID=UPI002FFC25A6